MSAAVNDSEEYYCFRVKESVDSELGVDDENIVIPCSYNFDLEKLRTELWKQFGVPRDRRIFYIDDDGDDVPIDSECEFHEALKLAKNAFVVNTAIPLIVGSFHVPTCSDDEQYSGTNEIYCQNLCSVERESRNINNNPISTFTEKNDGSISVSNLKFDKHSTWKIPSNEKKLDVRQCDESSEEQTESKDMKVPRESNASLPCHLNTVPPPWFIEYMEAMKKDMVSAITHEVVKNITEVLSKRLDSFAHPPLTEPSQSRSQSYSSLPKRHPRCSFDSNEKSQKRMKSQDEEQSSDASIERVDEPQNVNTAKDPKTEKDMISTISQEVVKEMTEMLNRFPLDSLTSAPSKKQSRSQSHLSSSKRFPRHFDSQSSEKNQRKMRLQDGEQSSDDASMDRKYEPRDPTIAADLSRQLQKKLDLLGDAICASVLKEEKRKKKHHQRVAQATADNLNSNIRNEQSAQNNAREDFIPWKNPPLQVDPVLLYDETPERLENELRMSCSVTGHQMLDEGRHSKDVWCCNNSNVDQISFWSCDQEEEDDDAFEIIQMSALENRNEFTRSSEESAAEQRRHDSNRDSPSFELLSEPPSPTCFMHFNEEHFSANEESAEQQSLQFANTNPSTNSIYVIDIHGKVYNEPLADLHERMSGDLEKRSGGAYSFVTETLPVQDTHCSKSCSEQRTSGTERTKNSRDNDTRDHASNTYDDVRNSHTSYLTVQTHCDLKTQCSCQSQTDSNDFTQSFHSHTTSVTDTADIYTDTYGNDRYGEQAPTTAKNVREAATATTTTTTTTTTFPRNDHDVGIDDDRMTMTEETRTNEKHYNTPKCFCASHSSTPRGISADSPYQSRRASGSSDRSNSNTGSRKASVNPDQTPGIVHRRQAPGTIHWHHAVDIADSAHILPLVTTAAASVGSYAYDTAREILNKIRAHTKEDSAKRRSGAKCDDKRRFFVDPQY